MCMLLTLENESGDFYAACYGELFVHENAEQDIFEKR